MENKNINESEYANYILIYIIESIINILDEKTIDIFSKNILYENENELLNFDDFDNNIIFYSYLISSFQNIKYNNFNLIKIQPIINQRNFLIFLNYLKEIVTNNKNAYKNSIIKINIYLIISYFDGNKSKDIINSVEYFNISQKEIEKIYKIKSKKNETIYDNKWKKEYHKNVISFKNTQLFNVKQIFSFIKTYFIKKNIFTYIDEIEKILNDLNNKINLNVENEIIDNDNYKMYFDLYLENKVRGYGYEKNNNEYQLKIEQLKKKLYDFKDISNLTNINDILCLLSIFDDSSKVFDNISDMYNNFKNNYDLLIKESEEDLTDEFKNILTDEEFYNKIKNILESKTVKEYLLNKRKFMNDNNIKIIYEFNEKYDDDLSEGYKNFMNYYYENIDCFNKLIIIKYLPKYKRAFVDPNMKIVINPLFIQLTNELNDDKEKKTEILKSYLIIILIHEIIHLLKFMKSNNFSKNNISQTPNNKEGGKIFINYLFGIPIINSISYSQAKEINNENNWNNIDDLHKIFNNMKLNYIKEEENDSYKINFYLSNNNEENEIEHNDWFDIN